MVPMRIALAIILFGALRLLQPIPVRACECAVTPFLIKWACADAVFECEAIRSVSRTQWLEREDPLPRGVARLPDSLDVLVRVLKSWKGALPETLHVFTAPFGTECGYPEMMDGGMHLLFCRRLGGVQYTSLCFGDVSQPSWKGVRAELQRLGADVSLEAGEAQAARICYRGAIDRKDPYRLEWVRALSNLGTQRGISRPLLDSLWMFGNPAERRVANEGLARMAPDREGRVSQLLRAMADSSAIVRQGAVSEVYWLWRESHMDSLELQRVLSVVAADTSSVDLLVYFLCELGSRARGALPALRHMVVERPRPGLSENLIRTIRYIESSP